jgi:hypothetical protein
MDRRATAPRLVAAAEAVGDRDALGAGVPAPRGGAGDLLLLVFLLVISIVPIVGFATGGRWGERMAGLATAIALLVARELARELRACVRAR